MKKFISLKKLKIVSLFTFIIANTLVTTAVKAETKVQNDFNFADDISTAIYNPPPTAKFTSPENGLETSDTRINVSFDITPNNTDLLNKNVYVQLFVVNTPSTTDQSAYYELLEDYKVLTFSSTTETQSLTFTNVPLLYSGDNYIYCFVQTSSGRDFCGGSYEATTLNVKYTGNRTPLYRFYSQEYTGHFYTINPGEKKIVINNYPDYTWYYEGLAYYVVNTDEASNCAEPGMTKVFRFWNPEAKHHFYTANAAEKDIVIATNKKFNYENVAFCGSETQIPGTVPVHRFYNAKKKTHFYTASQAEKDGLLVTDQSWNYEGVAYYAFN